MQDYFLILGTKCNKLGQEAGRIVRKAVTHTQGEAKRDLLAAHMPTKDISSHSGTDTQFRKFKTFAETGRVFAFLHLSGHSPNSPEVCFLTESAQGSHFY